MACDSLDRTQSAAQSSSHAIGDIFAPPAPLSCLFHFASFTILRNPPPKQHSLFANCEPTGLGEGTSCGEVLKVAVGMARTSAPVWALAVSSPPLILRSLGEGGSRAAASASPPAFLSSRVPYAFLPTPIIPHPNRRRQPPHFAKCGGSDADRGREGHAPARPPFPTRPPSRHICEMASGDGAAEGSVPLRILKHFASH